MTLDTSTKISGKLEIGKLYKLIKTNHYHAYGDNSNTFKLSVCKDVKNPIPKIVYVSSWRYKSLITDEYTDYSNNILYFNDIVVLLDIKTLIDTKYKNKNFNSEFEAISSEIHKILNGENSIYRNYCILSAGSKIYYCPENEFEYCFEKLDHD